MLIIGYCLPEKELGELRQAHREAHDKRSDCRIDTIVLLASGWSAEQVAQALLIDPDTAGNFLSAISKVDWRNCYRSLIEAANLFSMTSG